MKTKLTDSDRELEEFSAELPGELPAFLTPTGEARKAWKALWYADIERKGRW